LISFGCFTFTVAVPMTAPRHRSHAPVLAVRGGLDYGIPPASSSAGVI